jgi:hypothetical protein
MYCLRFVRPKILFITILFFYSFHILVNAQDTTPPLLTKIFNNSIMLNNMMVMDPDGNCEKVSKMNEELLKDITLFHKNYSSMKIPPKNYVTLCYSERASVSIINKSVLKSSSGEVECRLKGIINAIFIKRIQYDLATRKRSHIDTHLLTTWNTPLTFTVENFKGWVSVYNGREQIKAPITGYEFPMNPSKFASIGIQPSESYIDEDKANYGVSIALPEVDFTPGIRPNKEYLRDCNLAIDGSITGSEFSNAIEDGILSKTFKTSEGNCNESIFEVEIKFKPTHHLVVTPKDDFESSGPDPDGKFIPESKTYTLKNTGNDAIDFKITKKVQWLDISKASGTLAPKGVTDVTVSINESAKNLKEEVYKEEIEFINLTDGSGNTSRTVIVDVGEEQQWQLFFTGMEKRQYEIPKWKTPKNEPIRYGGQFNYKLRVDFKIKKKKGKWTYKSGIITIAEITYGTLYDPTYWRTRNEKNINFSGVTSLKGQDIDGTVDGNKVRFYWPLPMKYPIRYVEALFNQPCKPLPDCKKWKAIEYASDEFLDRAGDHYLSLKDGWESPKAEPFVIERPSDKLCWLNYRYVLKKIAPK